VIAGVGTSVEPSRGRGLALGHGLGDVPALLQHPADCLAEVLMSPVPPRSAPSSRPATRAIGWGEDFPKI
jgi:hypothetical protein